MQTVPLKSSQVQILSFRPLHINPDTTKSRQQPLARWWLLLVCVRVSVSAQDARAACHSQQPTSQSHISMAETLLCDSHQGLGRRF